MFSAVENVKRNNRLISWADIYWYELLASRSEYRKNTNHRLFIMATWMCSSGMWEWHLPSHDLVTRCDTRRAGCYRYYSPQISISCNVRITLYGGVLGAKTAVACAEPPAHGRPPRPTWSRATSRSIHLFACTSPTPLSRSFYRVKPISVVYRSIPSPNWTRSHFLLRQE